MQPCPTCWKNMAEGHGKCPACGDFCGCSFSPTSKDDYCNFHWSWATYRNGSVEVFRLLRYLIGNDQMRLLWNLTKSMIQEGNALTLSDENSSKADQLISQGFRLEAVREHVAVLREKLGVPTWTTRS